MVLEKQETPLFIRHLITSMLNGLAFGALSMSDVVAKKTLHATALSVTLLTMLPTISLLASLPLFHALGFGRRRRFILMTLAASGSIPLIMLNLYSPVWLLIVSTGIVQLANTVFPPSLNILFRRHYRKESVGKLYGIVSSAAVLASMVGAYLTGYLLDINDSLYRVIFPISGLFAFLAMAVLAYTPVEHALDLEFHSFNLGLLFAPFKSMKRVLTEDRDFYIFERNFFLYGIGFLLLLPVLPVYFVDKLRLDYTTISSARSVIGQLGVFFLSPFVGYLFDKQNPYRFTGYSFAILIAFPVFIALASVLPHSYVNILLYIGFGICSISMSGVGMSWNLSSIYFAEGRDLGVYQGIHVTLTGLRGLIGPICGYLVMRFFSYNATFLLSAFFFLLAAVLMLKTKPKV